ncbi:MAG: NADH:ubiquinone reductase (Na(+)-transporting) subunit C [Verrucomicrobia bacterium]|nr:NADH:ubiquinone reductase (Na(+)-transporting) subunit C [Verrucomicrobiota bacterium]MBT7067292.1 NADH:ubiquinone reductase (Na(+)-transporting) subunit C [Verrucomicrobiota bacterium]MBT7701239.1 NADH:ubiquinone reductase (Na(+)-transporting) subunit C [Verrucomicrobiota bacterium]
MRDQLKVIGFATVICLVCSVLLAVVSTGLAPRQARNKANDVKGKVLQVFGESVTDAKGKICVTPDELDSMYSERITGIVLDAQGHKVDSRTVDSLTAQEVNVRDKASRLKTFYPLYIYTAPESGAKRYAIHVSGKGLWSTVKAFMALEGDLSTIAGIVFYEHQETPGLGGEVEKPFFQDRFKGKKWIADGNVQPFRVTKPGAPITDHSVDGITAATMTCIGVERFLNADYAVYHRYFEQMKAQD